MNTLAERYDGVDSVELSLLPGVGHSFSQAASEGGLAERVFEFRYGSPDFGRQSPVRLFETGDRRLRLSGYQCRWIHGGVGR